MASKIMQMLNNVEPNRNEAHDFDDEANVKATKSSKLDNKKSTVKQAPPLPNIRENANKIMANDEEQKKIAFNLTTRLLSLIKDKTLDENKDLNIREEEKQVLSEYANFSRLINADPNKEDGLGTLSYVTALARCLLLQRDRINELEYKVIQLEKLITKNIRHQITTEDTTNK